MTNEDSHNPNRPSKPASTLSAFGAMLDLVSAKCTALVDAITHRDQDVSKLSQQMRGALDVVEAGIGDARRTLDAVDGGAR